MRKRSLNFKLVMGGIMAVLIPMVVVGVFSVRKTSTSLEAISKDRAVQISKNLADLVDTMLQEELKLVSGLSKSHAMMLSAAKVAEVGADNAAEEIGILSRELANMKKSLGEQYETLSVTDALGTVFADGMGGKDKGIALSERAYFKEAKAGKATVSNPVKSKSSGKPVVPVCSPIFSQEGQFVGTLVAVLKIDYLCDKLTSVKIGKTGYPFMVDGSGMTIAHPNKEFVFQLNVKDISGMEHIIKRMLRYETGIENYLYNGQRKIAAFAPVPLTGWCVAVSQSNSEFLEAANSIRNVILFITGLFLVLTIFGVFLFGRSLSKPIHRIIEGLNTGSDQVASAAKEVSAASQSLAEGASEQAASIEETSSSLEEMSSMTKQNADNATEADNLMREANLVVAQANESMQALTYSMAEISKASEETSKIIRTIDEIAFQTNLLALNAAVEAARAGEAGAGFAVVADEVRNLAMRAADAAKNTANLIEGTVKKVKDGSALVSKTNDAFSEVSQSAAKVGELVAEIAAASGEQARGIEQINIAVTEMDKVVQHNAASAEESASASEEMNAQAEQMKGMVNGLVILVQGGSSARNTDLRDAPPTVRRHHGTEKGQKVESGHFHKPALERTSPALPGVHEVKPEKIIPMNEQDFKDF